MNIYDIAEKAGVSIATVSRVLNDSANVSLKTKEKVLKIIADEGYMPNVFARGLNLNTMKMIGILCIDISDIFFARAVSVIENELKKSGYNSLLCSTGNQLENKKKCIDLLLMKRVDGLILIGSPFKEAGDNSHIEKAAQSVPTVIINGLIESENIHCILCNEYQAMYDNVIALFKKGHQSILYLYDVESYSGLQKLKGYNDALEACGLTPDPRLILKIPKTISEAKKAVEQVMALNIPFSAVLASEDLLAMGALHILLEKGYHIPDDVAIIGFNNSLLCECAVPSLTSVDNQIDQLCLHAIDVLKDIFNDKPTAHQLTLNGHLIQRQTFTC